jgi:hypothetical protein
MTKGIMVGKANVAGTPLTALCMRLEPAVVSLVEDRVG